MDARRHWCVTFKRFNFANSNSYLRTHFARCAILRVDDAQCNSISRVKARLLAGQRTSGGGGFNV